jgi:hypothetical protein
MRTGRTGPLNPFNPDASKVSTRLWPVVSNVNDRPTAESSLVLAFPVADVHFPETVEGAMNGARAPYGAMAQLAVVRRAFSFPVPEGVNDETAAALPNPGVSAWLSLAFRGKLMPDEKIDYVWGRPAEAFLATATRKEFAAITSETRFVQVGESWADYLTASGRDAQHSTDNSRDCRDSPPQHSGRCLAASYGACSQWGASCRNGTCAAHRY